MTKEKQDLLQKIIRIPTQAHLHKTLTKFLQKHYKTVIQRPEYIMAEGDIPIALVAHMDTVHKRKPLQIFYDQEETVMWSPQGLGADDRAGIFAIVDIIQRGFRPHIIFTTDEEVGGLGAHQLIQSFPDCPFAQLKFIIELDRANHNDCVFYECANETFIDYIEHFGFAEDIGSFTDISVIAPNWKVAAVNLSIGYYNEHSLGEYLVVSELEETIEKVIKILEDKESCYYEYVAATYYNKTVSECILCQKKIQPNQGIMTYHYGGAICFCPECYDGLIF